jgi:hypothetical protein
MSLGELQTDVEELETYSRIAIETTVVGQQVLLVLRSVPLPPGAYRVKETDVLLITDTQYRLSALDMFWTEPEVVLPNGAVPQNADSIEHYVGRSWRRYSWHRNGLWNPNRNGLLDHYEFMMARFAVDAVGPT